MKKRKWSVVLLILLACLVFLAWYSYGIIKGTYHKDSSEGVSLGLDLAGGVSITYEVAEGQNPSAEDMSDTIYKLQQRVADYSTEAQVYQVGTDRITVEIPGVSDANEILSELGSPGSLEFQDPDGETFMTGDMVADAQAGYITDSTTSSSEPVVELTLSDEGKEIFGEYTTKYVGEALSIVYDGEVISAPTVEEAITGGTCQITGLDSYEDCQTLASQIRSGAITIELSELQSEVVGAKLGTQAIYTSIIAALVGVLIVCIFMMIVYKVPGICASIALLIYSGMILAVLHLYHITLTLPGIAGIILSIGMAVDANVIIFARIKEEIGVGKSVHTAIDSGFKKAFSAILDGNVTTLIAAVVLYILGSGTVMSFAITLALGIILSMFTALVITRLLLKSFFWMGCQDKKWYGEKLPRKPFDFLGKRALFFIISLCVIASGFIGMGVYKSSTGSVLNFSLEFVGGTSSTVTFDKAYTLEEIDADIVPLIEDVTGDSAVEVQTVEGGNDVIFKTRMLTVDEREEFNTVMSENFGVSEDDITTTNISSTVSGEMRRDAIVAVVVAGIMMLVYIWFRFKDLRFASSAVIALMHDVLVVLAFYALSRTSVGTTFIACMLTIVGYSINATIVIFDRIRENLALSEGKRNIDYKDIVNNSITETLSRSINTSVTTFITIFMLYVLGVSSIREFALPIMVGLVAGAYSSVCITGALWYVFKRRFGKNRIQEAPEKAKTGKEKK